MRSAASRLHGISAEANASAVSCIHGSGEETSPPELLTEHLAGATFTSRVPSRPACPLPGPLLRWPGLFILKPHPYPSPF
ncbi:hypothetical protein F9K79_03765 [Ochrobactrum sp. Kaboul]|nr:hypothetical protein F9K79_03765 [Ochrobactrum sp. Kaboul]